MPRWLSSPVDKTNPASKNFEGMLSHEHDYRKSYASNKGIRYREGGSTQSKAFGIQCVQQYRLLPTSRRRLTTNANPAPRTS